MMQTKAKYGERLDQIVFREYKTLDYFEKVLEANPKIANKMFLDEGDIVNLPILKIDKKKLESLW